MSEIVTIVSVNLERPFVWFLLKFVMRTMKNALRVHALNNKARVIAYNTTIVAFIVFALVLGFLQYQNRSNTIREKNEMDSSLIDNAIRLENQFFLTQCFCSFMESPLLDFGGIRDRSGGECVFFIHPRLA